MFSARTLRSFSTHHHHKSSDSHQLTRSPDPSLRSRPAMLTKRSESHDASLPPRSCRRKPDTEPLLDELIQQALQRIVTIVGRVVTSTSRLGFGPVPRLRRTPTPPSSQRPTPAPSGAADGRPRHGEPAGLCIVAMDVVATFGPGSGGESGQLLVTREHSVRIPSTSAPPDLSMH